MVLEVVLLTVVDVVLHPHVTGQMACAAADEHAFSTLSVSSMLGHSALS